MVGGAGSNADVSVARRFHDETKHSEHRICGRAWADPDNKPSPYKTYASPASGPAPPSPPESRCDTLQVLTARARGTQRRVPDAGALAHLCLYANGLLTPGTDGAPGRRPASCTGGLHHVELYVVCGDLEALPAGVHHYDVATHRFRTLREGDHRASLWEATAYEEAVCAAPAVVICTSTVWRNAWRYGDRSLRHVFWDTGTVLANLTTLASALDLSARVVLGFVDDAVSHLLGLDPAREPVIALVPIGVGGREAPLARTRSLRTTPAPASRAEVVFPACLRMQRASSLRAPDEVRAWRASRCPEPLWAHPPWRPAAGRRPQPVEQVIRRRGSARRFAPAPISAASFGLLAEVACAPVEVDYGRGPGAGCVATHAVVHAVEGMSPGTYLVDDATSLVPVRRGSLRADATASALGQRPAGEAAATFCFVSDLSTVLERLGNRGYRAAQLTAGLLAGRLYLAAYALGLGATGLTFYDDQVVRLLGLPEGDAHAMLLLAVGEPRQGGGSP